MMNLSVIESLVNSRMLSRHLQEIINHKWNKSDKSKNWHLILSEDEVDLVKKGAPVRIFSPDAYDNPDFADAVDRYVLDNFKAGKKVYKVQLQSLVISKFEEIDGEDGVYPIQSANIESIDEIEPESYVCPFCFLEPCECEFEDEDIEN